MARPERRDFSGAGWVRATGGRGGSGRTPEELLGLDVVGDHLAVERLRVDGEERRRLAPVAAHLAQDRHDVLALHRLQAARRRRRRRRRGAQDLGRQVGRLDLVPLREDHRPLDGVE
jgi:hypothetical protein